MGGGDDVGLADPAAGKGVALVQQRLQHRQMRPERPPPGAQGASLGRTEAQERLFHPLVQQDGVDLICKPPVEPGQQTPHLGPFSGIGGQQQGFGRPLLQPAEDGGGFAKGQGASIVFADPEHRGHARRVQRRQRAVVFPRADGGLGEFDPCLAQRQSDGARAGIEGKMVEDEARHGSVLHARALSPR